MVEAQQQQQQQQQQQRFEVENCGTKWRDFIQKIRYDVFGRFLRTIAHHAAVHPMSYVFGIAIMSFVVAITGLFTNFYLDTSSYDQWTPAGSYPEQHRDWYRHESNFSVMFRTTSLLVHHVEGNNVATREGLEFAFEALDVVLELPAYQEVCGEHVENPCFLTGVTRFWDNNSTLFHKQMEQNSDNIIATISQETYPDGYPVEIQREFGNPGILWDENIVFVQAYAIILAVPDSEEAMELEKEISNVILAFQEETRDNEYQVQLWTDRAFGDEFMRAILRDLPLMPIAFILMSLFTMIALSKRHPVLSRSLLGFGAVCCVFLAIISGFGLMFCIGVPFASMNQILPFIMFGIGLDDAFIILGAFVRTDPKKPIVDRIDETIEEIGSSIALTTITSSLAFGLGALSGIPAVKSLCHYAYTTILMDFFYQLTFFVALVVLDERRIQANRRNCLPCWFSTTDDSDTKMSERSTNGSDGVDQTHFTDRMMRWYAKKLLRPWVKVTVIALFSAWFGLCFWSATQLTQEFRFTEVLPQDSFLVDFVRAAEEYSDGFLAPFPSAFFRCVDQSDPHIQDQMIQYVDELVNELDEITQPPQFFWLRDFRNFIDQFANDANGLADLTFNEQLDFFLDIPIFHQLYSHEIVRDERTGDIITSSVVLLVDNVDQEDVDDVVVALANQREVTLNQPINTVQGLSDRIENAPYCENTDETFFAFFLYHEQFQNWEFYSVAVYELILSTITGIVAVTLVGMLLVPHWTAGLFVLPLICILYVDVLGILQFAGLHINAVTYVATVMSIGLMVDFIMHVMLRYYECESHLSRHEKVIETLGTMGASVLLGGTSSLIGVLPLWGTTSTIIQTIFKAFITLVVVGLSHGLIFLPVVLSIIGPLNTLPSTSSTPGAGNVVEATDFDGDDLEKPVDHHRQQQIKTQQQQQQRQEEEQSNQLQEEEQLNQQQQEEEAEQRRQEERLRQQQQQEDEQRQEQQEEQLRQQQEERLRQEQQQEEQPRQEQQQGERLRQQQQQEQLKKQHQEEQIRQQQEEEQLTQHQQDQQRKQQQEEEQLKQQQQQLQLRHERQLQQLQERHQQELLQLQQLQQQQQNEEQCIAEGSSYADDH